MKSKLLNLLLVITSLFGYLAWGTDQHSFLFQAEAEVLRKLIHDPASAAHPFTLIPLFGQLLLLITLFQKQVSKRLTYIGLACIGLLLLLIFIIGLMGLNVKIIASILPFLVVSFLIFRNFRNANPKAS